MWPQYQCPDHYSQQSAQQHRACCHILGEARQGMVLGTGKINAYLNDRVKYFREKDARDGDVEHSKLDGRNVQENACKSHCECAGQVNACVTLGTQCVPETTRGVSEAKQESGDWPPPGFLHHN